MAIDGDSPRAGHISCCEVSRRLAREPRSP
jgi:hypothetical protein